MKNVGMKVGMSKKNWIGNRENAYFVILIR
jgi:hypothetical protein